MLWSNKLEYGIFLVYYDSLTICFDYSSEKYSKSHRRLSGPPTRDFHTALKNSFKVIKISTPKDLSADTIALNFGGHSV